MTTTEWHQAYTEIVERIQADEQFLSLVRAMTGYPRGNSRRARKLANQICKRQGLNPEVFRGTAYGAALARMPGSGF